MFHKRTETCPLPVIETRKALKNTMPYRRWSIIRLLRRTCRKMARSWAIPGMTEDQAGSLYGRHYQGEQTAAIPAGRSVPGSEGRFLPSSSSILRL